MPPRTARRPRPPSDPVLTEDRRVPGVTRSWPSPRATNALPKCPHSGRRTRGRTRAGDSASRPGRSARAPCCSSPGRGSACGRPVCHTLSGEICETRSASAADSSGIRRRLESIRELPTLAERLLGLLGDAVIRRRLPASVVAALEHGERKLSGGRLAEVAVAVFGVDVLKNYEADLASAGFVVPRRWRGSAAARAFAADAGFPPEYAGFESRRLSPMV